MNDKLDDGGQSLEKFRSYLDLLARQQTGQRMEPR